MYLNKAQKEMIISLSGVVGFCNTMAKSDYVSSENKEKLLTASKLARDVMEDMEIGADEDQLRGVIRFAKNCVLLVMPNTHPMTDEDCVVVSRSTVSRIVSDSLCECFFCEKNMSEVKKCQTRKDLLECGVDGKGSPCPFMF